jgi:uncharacterized damage-inducible protein DinB
MATSEEIGRLLAQLRQGPSRIAEAARDIQPARLDLRTEEEPWSVRDILAHLRACSDVWGGRIVTMIEEDHPSMRYVSPRSWMRKPKYRDASFDAALESFAQERQKLVSRLAALDAGGWARPGTFTGTSARQRHQTVWSYSERIVKHEGPHLGQIEALLR